MARTAPRKASSSTARTSASAAPAAEPSEDEALDTAPKAPLEPLTVARWFGYLVLAFLFGFGVFVVWHRPRDPMRQWSARVGEAYERKVNARLSRCFGGYDAATVRRGLDELRAGRWPAAYAACRGPVLTELLAAPGDFAADIVNPPGAAERAQATTRDALTNLSSALTRFERVARELPREGAVPEAARAPLADALDDVATYTDQARNATGDLRRVVEQLAAWY